MSTTPRPSRTLTWRMVSAALLGACVVAVVAVLLAVPLVRGVARDQSHHQAHPSESRR